MRKLYYLLIFIFSFSVLSAQEKLSKEEKARREKNIQAGNPFAKYGYKAKVATLSKGKYLEFHDLDSIVTIGTIRWHVDKNQIVGRIKRDSLNPDEQPIGDAPGRWMSPDPLSEEFPSYSPYNFCFNNPMKFVDPDGRAPTDWVNFTGKNGQQQIIFDSSIKTKEQAGAKYSNVKEVFETGIGRSAKTGEVVNFQKDGKFSVNGGDTMDTADSGFTTEGGTYIGKNLTGVEQVATALQAGGDGITAIGIVTAQPEIIAAGEIISNVGLGVELANDFANKGVNAETLTNTAVKVGINVGFGQLNKAGINATRTVAGEQYVKSGANNVSEAIIQGTTTTGAKATEKIINGN